MHAVLAGRAEHRVGESPVSAAADHEQIRVAVGRTRVIYETRPLAGVNDAISEVLHGKAKARLVLEP
jgi:hypothetical protein